MNFILHPLEPDFRSQPDITLEVYDNYSVNEEGKIEYIGIPQEIEANKSLLGAFSKYFLKLFSKEWQGGEIKTLKIPVENKKLFSILINSFYNFNTVDVIVNITDCEERLSLIRTCSQLEIPIPFEELLSITHTPDKCFENFIYTLGMLSYDLRKFKDLIAERISNIDDLKLLQEDLKAEIEEKISLKRNVFATGGPRNLIKIRDAETGNVKLEIKDRANVYHIVFSPDGSRLASVNVNNTITIWSTMTGKPILTFSVYTAIAFSPDSTQVALIGIQEIHICDSLTGELLKVIKVTSLHFKFISFSHDGLKIMIANPKNRKFEIFDVSTGELELQLEKNSTDREGEFSPDDLKIITIGDGIKIWDARNGNLVRKLENSEDEIMFKFLDNDKIVSTKTNRITIWNIENGTKKEINTDDVHYYQFLALSPDGKRIILASGNKISFWDLQTGKLDLEIKDTAESIASSSFR